MTAPERVSAIQQSVNDARSAVDRAMEEYRSVLLARSLAESER